MPGHPIRAAFYGYTQGRMQSLRSHAASLTHLMPTWFSLSRDGTEVIFADFDPLDDEVGEVLGISRKNGLKVFPVLSNASRGTFERERVARLLDHPDAQLRVAIQIRDSLLAQNLSGVNIDFENLTKEDFARLPLFLKKLSLVLHDSHLSTSIDLAGDQLDRMPLAEIGNSVDFVVIMAYDHHSALTAPGPIAPLDWSIGVVRKALSDLPPSKIVLGTGDYGYDWPGGKPAKDITFGDAMHLAALHGPPDDPGAIIDLPPSSLNPCFKYTDPQGVSHEVWFLDALTVRNQSLVASRSGLAGLSVWELGGEDPSLWSQLGASPSTGIPGSLFLPDGIQYEGNGEIVSSVTRPVSGSRSVEIEAPSGLALSEHFGKLPSGTVIKRIGATPGVVALTFDDGPNEATTPKILDLFARNGVHGTFFLIGRNAVENPSLVRRIWESGSEIGNHTFTHPYLGSVGPLREHWELNATQRAIQMILGRSTLLFRAPYYVETAPEGADVDFVEAALKDGYLCVGAAIDPKDWKPLVRNEDDVIVRNTGRRIASEIENQLKAGQGNVVLLHDGGGNRGETLRALESLIPELKSRGWRFVTVSELAKTERDALMPPVNRGDSLAERICRIDLAASHGLFLALTVVLGIAIMISAFRVFVVTVLAIVANRKSLHSGTPPDWGPRVSVLIPAHNESKVIVSCIRSILAQSYRDLEVVVVDDGSTDGTAPLVKIEFSGDSRVLCVSKPNGGKASALNAGIEHASGDILLCIDADTQFEPGCVALMARHFLNPKIGALAGNIRVGNMVDLLTRTQALEYITSQNLDRLAFSLFGAVTLVPGAIGAFRKSAVLEAGGYLDDTLAEDFELTCRIRKNGWLVGVEQRAMARTEAPEDVASFFKQRTRWSFGTLQTLWKTRGMLFRHGAFGCLGMPLRVWEFFYYALCLILYIVGAVVFLIALSEKFLLVTGHSGAFQPELDEQIQRIFLWFCILMSVEVFQGFVALRMDKADLKLLLCLPFEALFYRPMIYMTLWRSFWRAAWGQHYAWGYLKRMNSMKVSRAVITTPVLPASQ